MSTHPDEYARATSGGKEFRLLGHFCSSSAQFLQCSNLTLFYSIFCRTPDVLWRVSLLRESKHELKSNFLTLLTCWLSLNETREFAINVLTLQNCFIVLKQCFNTIKQWEREAKYKKTVTIAGKCTRPGCDWLNGFLS